MHFSFGVSSFNNLPLTVHFTIYYFYYHFHIIIFNVNNLFLYAFDVSSIVLNIPKCSLFIYKILTLYLLFL